MFDVKTRKDEGFVEDAFPGWIVYNKDGKPFLQLHVYPEFYTVFWRGHTNEQRLWNYLERARMQVSDALGMKLDAFNSGSGTFVTNAGERATLFVFDPTSDEERRVQSIHRQLVGQISSELLFVRYDTAGLVPLIIWADILATPQSEVGFSSKLIPQTVFDLLAESCAYIDTEEIPELKSSLERQLAGAIKG
jgi:hypothetical protein